MQFNMSQNRRFFGKSFLGGGATRFVRRSEGIDSPGLFC